MKKLIAIIFIFLIITTALYAQKITISGTVQDTKTGEALIGASIRLKATPSVGTVTNDYGFYSLTLEKGTYTLLFDFIGYVLFGEYRLSAYSKIF